MIITTEMIMKKEPCKEYTQERVQELVGEGKTLLELTELDIPALDRVWVITRFLNSKTNRKFAIWCARRCKISIQAITDYVDITEKYYNGKATKEELRAARSVACSTSYHVAYHAINHAAYYTADYAANHAADYAAYFAAYHAIDYATHYAANPEVEQKRQIEKLKELIGEK